MKKVFLHLDLDAFFATAEQSVRPNLVGKPLAIGISKKRGIISTVSYEGRIKGLYAGMPVYKAKELCPDLVLVPSNFSLYSKKSGEFFKYIIKNYTNKLEVNSIDECNLDATELLRKKPSLIGVMKDIQENVFKHLRLKVSIGASWNVEMAKIAANINKPLGIKVLPKESLKSEVWSMKVNKITGIGLETYKKLLFLGIETIGDLANYNDLKRLVLLIGEPGYYFHGLANGYGRTTISQNYDSQKSLSKEETFDIDIETRKEALEHIEKLCREVCRRCEDKNLVFGVVKVSVKDETKQRTSSQEKIESIKTNQFDEIWKIVEKLYDKLHELGPFRLLSFGVSGLEDMFDYFHNLEGFNWALNKVGHNASTYLNAKYGKRVIMTAAEWEKHKNHEVHDKFLKGSKN